MWQLDPYVFCWLAALKPLRKHAQRCGVDHPYILALHDGVAALLVTDGASVRLSIHLGQTGFTNEHTLVPLEPADLETAARQVLRILQRRGTAVTMSTAAWGFVFVVDGEDYWLRSSLTPGKSINPLTRYADLTDNTRLTTFSGVIDPGTRRRISGIFAGGVLPPFLAPQDDPAGVAIYIDDLGMVIIDRHAG